ncbi:hypothetical protein [Variovorax sp.]|uniref:hypothetical protein n=1 Tax=Variovorax sp. TaxID=1871043 RepID=UPI0025FFA383|nr:hypothetical protein [Variovorax sp.]
MSYSPEPRHRLQEIFMSSEKLIHHRKRSTVKRTLVGLGAAILFSGAAFAQNHTSEAVPQTNTKPQVAAEAKKSAKPMGTKSIKDGSTAEGEGSGVKKTSKPEATGQGKAAVREARPHSDPGQGGTPK